MEPLISLAAWIGLILSMSVHFAVRGTNWTRRTARIRLPRPSEAPTWRHPDTLRRSIRA